MLYILTSLPGLFIYLFIYVQGREPLFFCFLIEPAWELDSKAKEWKTGVIIIIIIIVFCWFVSILWECLLLFFLYGLFKFFKKVSGH